MEGASVHSAEMTSDTDLQQWVALVDAWKEINSHMSATHRAWQEMLLTTQNTEELLKRWIEIYGGASASTPPERQ